MNKQELIYIIAKKTGQSKIHVKQTIDTFIDTVQSSIASNDKVQLIGFGTFLLAKRNEREGRHPKTGNLIKIAATKTARFIIGKNFKNTINKKK